ncbi:hypothetical protein [Lacticaseibacillus paracasei]|uniref:hypothetical protein n=1 Tax=Lacticaseibacillus paracasei TaxID=1597 RepID=UPI002358E624|nr:hypothetical protein [Lacticaseibacillus paracasei]WCZ14857.1 hypothetical protein HKJ34_03005 [Lacticaseibacillus paracasei]
MEGKRGSECLLKSVSNIDFNPLLKAMDIKITLDDGTLVGRLAPEIDKSLAVLKRRNYAY